MSGGGVAQEMDLLFLSVERHLQALMAQHIVGVDSAGWLLSFHALNLCEWEHALWAFERIRQC